MVVMVEHRIPSWLEVGPFSFFLNLLFEMENYEIDMIAYVLTYLLT